MRETLPATPDHGPLGAGDRLRPRPCVLPDRRRRTVTQSAEWPGAVRGGEGVFSAEGGKEPPTSAWSTTRSRDQVGCCWATKDRPGGQKARKSQTRQCSDGVAWNCLSFMERT